MAEPSSPDTQESSPKQSTGISRRALLKGAAATAVLAVPAVAAAVTLTRSNEPQANSANNTPPPEPQNPKPEPQEEPKSELYSFLENHPLLINLSQKQKKLVEGWVLNQINHYKRESDSQKIASIDDVLLPDLKIRVEDSGKWQSDIDRIASEKGFYLDSFTRSILTGLIFVESEGNPDKLSPKGAKGLCQLMPTIAAKLAEEFHIDLGKNQEKLYDLEINIGLCLEYIHKLYKLFPDPTLAIWAYHLGETNLSNFLNAYMVEKYQKEGKSEEEIKQMDRDFDDIWTKASVKYITAEKDKGKIINFADILTSEAVQKLMVEGLRRTGEPVPIDDDTQYYVARILAGEYLIKTQNQLRTTA